MRFHLAAILSVFLCFFSAPLMAAEVLLTVADARFPVETDDPRPEAVYVRLDPESTQTFAEFSGQHIGEMTEFYVGDQLVFSVRLTEAITAGNLAFFVGAKDERISSPKELLEQLEAGAPIRVIAPPSEE